jgi:hypothetical protein
MRICLASSILALYVLSPYLVGSEEEVQALKYKTTWLGNSFGGGPKWVQNFADDLCVLADGTCVVGCFWDEAGREVGLYKDGQPIGKLEDTHMRGGKAVTATSNYVFSAHTCAREDQPAVKAGEARQDKAVCLFGVSRWNLKGKVAPFEGGATHHKNMKVFNEAFDNHDLIPRGLATDGKLLYVADTTSNRIRVLDVETMKPIREFPAEKPERLALDKAGNVWAIQTGGRRILSFTDKGKPREQAFPMPEKSIAAAINFSPDGQLMVADHGPRQQILFFDVTKPIAPLAGTFGDEGGMFAGPNPGRAGPMRLAMPTGAGFDAAGNLYVACNVPRGGTVLRAFNPKKELRWELLGLEFVSVADVVPGSDGRDVLTCSNRYAFDPTAEAGKGWKWVGLTYNPFRSPDDLRKHFGILQCATSVRMLEGKPFLCQRGMWQGALGIYRQEGELFVPSVVLSSEPLKTDQGDWKPAGQPKCGRWLWRDLNGNGQFDAGEYTTTESPTGEYWASNVDSHGDIWQAGRDTGVWRWKFLGLDERGNPKYDPKADHWPMPAPFNDLLRTEYEPESDTMYLTGQTKDRPIRGGEWGSAGTVVVRIDHWSKKPTQRYRVDLPYKPESILMVSFHVAGDLFFVVDCKQANVYVYDNQTGKLLGIMKPGPEVHGESGWVDFRDALRATRLKDGSYLVFVEEDSKGKVMIYHLDDPKGKKDK